MPILFSYIFLTALRFQVAMFSGFALLLVGQQVIGILENLPNIELVQLALIVIFTLPDALNDIAPIALVLSVLLTGNQLYSQCEIYILRNAGQNSLKTSLPLMALALVTGLVMTVNASYLKPIAELKLSKLVFEVTNANFTSYLIPGEFREIKSLGITLSAQENNNDKLKNVFIYHQPSDQVISGKSAFIQNHGPYNYSLIVENGSLLQVGVEGSAVNHFERYSAQLIKEAFKPRNSVEFKDSFELYQLTGNFPTAEFQWRLSRFWYCLFLVAIALLFIPKTPRAGTSLAIFSGLLMYFAFNSIADNAYRSAAKGELNPSWVFWWLYPVMYVMALTSTYLLSRVKRAF